MTTEHSPSHGLRRLVGGSVIYAATRALLSGSRFLLIPLYVRYLPPDQYGIVGIAGIVASVLTVLLLAGMERAVAREYFDYRHDAVGLRSYLRTVYAFLLIVNVGITAVLLAVGPRVAAWAFPKGELPFYPYLLLATTIAVATSFYAVLMVYLQVREQPRAYAAFQLGRFIVMTAATLLFIAPWRMGATGVLLAELLATAGAAVVLGYSQWRSLAAGGGGAPAPSGWFDRVKLRRSLAYGLPFIPYEVIAWVMSGSDRFILTRMRSLEEVGVYTLAMTLAMGLNIVTMGMNLAFSPYFFRVAQEHQGDEPPPALARLIEAFAFAVGAACLLGMLFSREVLALVASGEYVAADPVLPVLLFSAFISGLYSVVILPLLHQKRTTSLPLIFAFGAILNVAWNLLLVPRFGIVGAAWGNLAANLLVFVLAFRAASAGFRLPYQAGAFWGVLGTVALSGFSLHSASIAWRTTGFFVALSAMAYANRGKLALLRAG